MINTWMVVKACYIWIILSCDNFSYLQIKTLNTNQYYVLFNLIVNNYQLSPSAFSEIIYVYILWILLA